jgi:hypothetical protein
MNRAIAIGLSAILLCASAQAQKLSIPRTPDGHPDFQGVWESLWLTPLERPDGVPGVELTEAEAGRVKQMFLEREANRAKAQLGTEGEIAIATNLLRVNGGYRGSQVVDPPDGRIPRTEAGKAARLARANSDGPESFNRGARCLSGAGGVPMVTSNFDAMHRIVQTAGAVVIYSESISDTRITSFAAGLSPLTPRSMGGTSIARWEGDTLVIETSRFDGAAPIGVALLSDDAVVVERFWLASPDELDFRYTVTDPRNYTQPWSGEMAWLRSSQRLYETVCHEGNYSLANMLLAARMDERRAAPEPPRPPPAAKAEPPASRERDRRSGN